MLGCPAVPLFVDPFDKLFCTRDVGLYSANPSGKKRNITCEQGYSRTQKDPTRHNGKDHPNYPNCNEDPTYEDTAYLIHIDQLT